MIRETHHKKILHEIEQLDCKLATLPLRGYSGHQIIKCSDRSMEVVLPALSGNMY